MCILVDLDGEIQGKFIESKDQLTDTIQFKPDADQQALLFTLMAENFTSLLIHANDDSKDELFQVRPLDNRCGNSLLLNIIALSSMSLSSCFQWLLSSFS